MTAPEEPTALAVVKHGGHVYLSPELLADANGMSAAVRRLMSEPPPTPEEAAAWREQAARERAAARAAARPVRPTLARVVERMGWSWAYLDHLVQPYCTCGAHGPDGEWETCEHAYDLGVTS